MRAMSTPMTMDSAQAQQHTGRRVYKSRKNRPCDLCRARKQACAIDTQPPCDFCRAKGRQCTFVKDPGPRQRPNRQRDRSDVTEASGSQSIDAQPAQQDTEILGPLQGFTASQLDFDFSTEAQPTVSEPLGSNALDRTQPLLQPESAASAREDLSNDFQVHGTLDAVASRGQISEKPSPWWRRQRPTTERLFTLEKTVSLEQQVGRSYRFVGPSGELDTYLISRRRCNDYLQSESPYTGILYQYASPLDSTAIDFQPPAVFTVGDTVRLENSEPKLLLSSSAELRATFRCLVPNALARGLIRLFTQFISPSFPILSPEQTPTTDEEVDGMCLSLLAAICASSLPFIIYDDALCVEQEAAPPAAELFRIAWTALQLESHDVRLSTIQSSLLILQRQAREDLFGEASFNLRLCATIVASCHTLGLNHDPSGWSVLSLWERKLRIRLWWAVFVTDTWTAFGQGMPPHIQLEDSDVPPLEIGDFVEDAKNTALNDEANYGCQFYYLVTLSFILRDIRSAFYTLRAMQSTTGDLQLALNIAKPLRARLMRWHQELPLSLRLSRGTASSPGSPTRDQGMDHLGGKGSLRLAYVVAQLSLFRALLRPLAMAAITAQQLSEPPSFWDSDGAVAAVQGGVRSVKELVKFVESLSAADWDSFWHSWSKHNFAMASTFLMHILVLTQPSQSGSINGLSPQQDSPSYYAAPATAYSPLSVGSSSNDMNHAFSAEYGELQVLAKRWRWALRLAERGAAGRKGLMSASLRRTEALFKEWQLGQSTQP